MPGFDFSNSSLAEWKTPLPTRKLALFIDSASWDHGKIDVRVTSVVSDSPLSQQYWHQFAITCEPVFAVLFAQEAMATSLWRRSNELGRPGDHLILRNSDWVTSFKTNEPYGDSWQKGEAVHYVLCASNDFAHLICKKPPVFSALGIVPADPSDGKPPPLSLQRDWEDMNPVQKLLSRIFFGRRRKIASNANEMNCSTKRVRYV